MVESTGLENRRTRKGIVSSNLTLSACGQFIRGKNDQARWVGGVRRQRAWCRAEDGFWIGGRVV